MFMVVQNRRYRCYKYVQSMRFWTYKTEAGARRRVWLCKQSKDNIGVFYFDLSSEEEK